MAAFGLVLTIVWLGLFIYLSSRPPPRQPQPELTIDGPMFALMFLLPGAVGATAIYGVGLLVVAATLGLPAHARPWRSGLAGLIYLSLSLALNAMQSIHAEYRSLIPVPDYRYYALAPLVLAPLALWLDWPLRRLSRVGSASSPASSKT